jgi:hypothetical protein
VRVAPDRATSAGAPVAAVCALRYRLEAGGQVEKTVGLSLFERISNMLYTLAVVLVVLWLLGLVTSYTMGGFIHVLLVIAIVVVLVRVISGRSVV